MAVPVERNNQKNFKNADEYFETVLNVRRVAKVIKGGRRFAFSALVVVGDRSGRVGFALGKSRDVSSAISKALKKARKTMFTFPMHKTTLPFTVQAKHSASKVLLRRASKGTGIIAGGAVRAVMEALGVKDILTKTLGSHNPHNVVQATIKALSMLRSGKEIAAMRGKTLKDLFGENEDVTA